MSRFDRRCGLFIILWTALVAPNPIAAQEDDSFAQLDREYEQFVGQMELEQRAFLEETEKEYQEFVEEVEQQWGAFVPSTRPRWSSYSNDLQAHGEVDFDKGTVVVEVLTEPEAVIRAEKIIERLFGQLEAMMSEENPSKRNVLEGQLDKGDGLAAEPEELRGVIKRKIEAGEVSRRTVSTPDGKSKMVISLELLMVPDHLSRAAKPFLKLAREYANRFALDLDLVLAVIHTESWFNPLARSSIPAFGLMQLVPRTGALDAYEFVYGKNRLVNAQYLYNPEKNLELGCAYLHLLMNRYLAMLEQPESRVLAAIAAYNCGPGNARKALRSLDPNGEVPRHAPPDKVRAALLSRAPEETRKYLRLVTARRNMWRGGG